MRIYEITSSQWETDEYFPSQQAAKRRAAKIKDIDYRLAKIEFRPTKENVLSMLNRERYADVYEVLVDHDPVQNE